MSKKQLVSEVAAALSSYGYKVYLAKSGEYGFYTDGKTVVSFGGSWNFSLDFSGNYGAESSEAARSVGTGWGIAKDMGVPSQEQTDAFISALPPRWATKGLTVLLTTPEQHLKTYGTSSGYVEFQAPEVAA